MRLHQGRGARQARRPEFQVGGLRRSTGATLCGTPSSESVRAAHALVRKGRPEWHGERPVVRPLKPRWGCAKGAEAVLEDQG